MLNMRPDLPTLVSRWSCCFHGMTSANPRAIRSAPNICCSRIAGSTQGCSRGSPEPETPHVTPTACNGFPPLGQTKQHQLPVQDSPVNLSHAIQIHLSTYFTNCPVHGKRRESQITPAQNLPKRFLSNTQEGTWRKKDQVNLQTQIKSQTRFTTAGFVMSTD